MKILLAPDKFRGSLTALDVCNAMRDGILAANPTAEVIAIPMADGGEGTAEILTQDADGFFVETEVMDPLWRPIRANFGMTPNRQTAFLEMASASGLKLLRSEERNPLKTSTYGTGELIIKAIEAGAKHIILGIGGSATTDAGIGMAAALGWRFCDKTGNELEPIGENLLHIEQIIPPDSPLIDVTIDVACDVTAPLFGSSGAAYVYGPQKGADEAAVKTLDAGLQHVAAVIQRDFGIDLAHQPGTGAAGGLGFGLLFFLKANLKEGVKIVMEQTHFEEQLAGVDLVFTGEGKMDEQTLQGKLIAGIARAAKERNIPVIALCGTLLLTTHDIQSLGLSYARSILPRPMALPEAIEYAYQGVKETSHSLVSLLTLLQQ